MDCTIDSSLLKGEIPDFVVCAICLGVLREPLEFPCGHIACRRCLMLLCKTNKTNKVSCIMCKAPELSLDELRVCRFVENRVASLQCACPHECGTLVTLGRNFKNLEEHWRKCPNMKVQCLRCSTSVPATNYLEHLQTHFPGDDHSDFLNAKQSNDKLTNSELLTEITLDNIDALQDGLWLCTEEKVVGGIPFCLQFSVRNLSLDAKDKNSPSIYFRMHFHCQVEADYEHQSYMKSYVNGKVQDSLHTPFEISVLNSTPSGPETLLKYRNAFEHIFTDNSCTKSTEVCTLKMARDIGALPYVGCPLTLRVWLDTKSWPIRWTWLDDKGDSKTNPRPSTINSERKLHGTQIHSDVNFDSDDEASPGLVFEREEDEDEEEADAEEDDEEDQFSLVMAVEEENKSNQAEEKSSEISEQKESEQSEYQHINVHSDGEVVQEILVPLTSLLSQEPSRPSVRRRPREADSEPSFGRNVRRRTEG